MEEITGVAKARSVLVGHGFTQMEVDLLAMNAIDLDRILALIAKLGPVIVPVIQAYLARLPRTALVVAIEELLKILVPA